MKKLSIVVVLAACCQSLFFSVGLERSYVSAQSVQDETEQSARSVMTRGVLGRGTEWETPWYVIRAKEPGPTVLVVGGIHGNEPAGFRAAEQIKDWPISRGTMVVLPKVNRLGLAANTRWLPAFRNDRSKRDINRNFPTGSRDDPVTPVGEAVWGFVSKHRPEWVFDLHEGFDFHRVNKKSVGSSIISFPKEAGFAKTLQEAVNLDRAVPFDLLVGSGPASGSLARACAERWGARSFILETTFKDQSISARTRQHRQMMSRALLEIGMIGESCVDRLVPVAKTESIRVGVFDGAGANERRLVGVLDSAPGIILRHLGRDDIESDSLDQFDVLLFPGGSGSKQGKAIGEKGREKIRQFVRDGGGVIGVCAGAYLCTTHYRWSLDLVNAAVFNEMVDVPGKGRKSMWYRGPGTEVDVEFTGDGKSILGLGGQHSVRYENGPIISPGADKDLPAYRVLANFRSENGIYAAQKNTMIGAPAVVAAQYGAGQVLAISPHFESTRDTADVILRAVRHVCPDR